MSLPEQDAIRLRHMLEAAEQALQFCVGRDVEDVRADRMLRFALAYAITVVGEAASKVTQPTRDGLPEIAWVLIVGMRNRLVHAYFDIDIDVLWQSVTERLPPLASQLRLRLSTP